MAAKGLVRQGETEKNWGNLESNYAYARPGQIVCGDSDQGSGPILYTTPLHCIFRNEKDEEILLRWADVLLSGVKPDPRFSMKLSPARRSRKTS